MPASTGTRPKNSLLPKESMRRFFFIAMALLGLIGVMSIAAATDSTDRAVGILISLTGFIGAVAAATSKRTGT